MMRMLVILKTQIYSSARGAQNACGTCTWECFTSGNQYCHVQVSSIILFQMPYDPSKMSLEIWPTFQYQIW